MLNKKAFLIIVFLTLLFVLVFGTTVVFSGSLGLEVPDNNSMGPRSITRTSNGILHAVFWKKDGNASRLYYINSSNNGTSWSTPFLLSQNYDNSKHACLTTDESGKLYVFWADLGKIFYSETTDGATWGPIYKVSGSHAHADFPSAVVGRGGNIYLAYENEGDIYYRTFQTKENAWSVLHNVSQTSELSKSPQITVLGNEKACLTWVENGAIAYRENNIAFNTWNAKEIISNEAELLYSLKKNANLNPQIIADLKNGIHIIWNNGSKVIHRLKMKEFWSPAAFMLSNEAMPWLGAPTCTIDMNNDLYCAWVEKGVLAIKKYDANQGIWNKHETTFTAFEGKFHTVPVLGPAWHQDTYKPLQGFDLIYTTRSDIESKDFRLSFLSEAEAAKTIAAPEISSVTQVGGKISVSWQPAAEQYSYKVIIGSTNPVVTPYLYDSGIVHDSSPAHTSAAFAIKTNELYIQVKTADQKGVWSAWSSPYRYVMSISKSNKGPQLVLKGIEENSLYLYSPSANILYFGNGLDTAKTFTIYGSAIGKNSGIKEISFSPFGTNNPPPIKNPDSNDWEVQYSILSSDTSGEIIITAADFNNQTAQERIKIYKDSTPPEPPTWVRVNPDQEGQKDFTIGEKKVYNKNKVYVFWKDGADNESGIRYHVMGSSDQWWKNSVHRSGDSEIGNEGNNTFFVYAVDHVGNVSAPGTDTLFIDTVAPFPPKFSASIVSKNIISGTKSPDTEKVLVNGATSKVAFTSKTDWNYTSSLKDGETQIFTLQAIDSIGNASEIVSRSIRCKSTPPAINSIKFTPEGPFRGKDTIIFELAGEPGNSASIDLPNVEYGIALYDDGSDEDKAKGDGLYTGVYKVNKDTQTIETEVVGKLADEAGNEASYTAKGTLKINSHQSILLDDFEILGKPYPWSNHVEVKNIDPATEKDILFQNSGSGICKIEYDFAGQQNWAGFSSREFLPRNCYGIEPRLSLHIKGSGSAACRAAIKIRTKANKEWSKTIKEFPASPYTFSLANNNWTEIEVPLPEEAVENLDEVLQYSLVLYSPNNKEKGTLYIDNLKIVYKSSPRGRFIPTGPLKELLPEDKKDITFEPVVQQHAEKTETVYPNMPKGSFIPAPYLSPIFYPNPLRVGSPVRLKISIPEKYRPTEVAVLLFNENGRLISCKLKNTNQTWWSGVTSVPAYMKEGNYFGTIYVKTAQGAFLKTRFPFQMIPSDSHSSIDQVATTFYPHPLIPGLGTTIKVRLPRNIQTKNVALFFGESNGTPTIANLFISKITETDEYWQGQVTLPADLAPGDYTALLYLKNRQNEAYKKKITYSILEK